jgi:hypothetical protein
MKWATVSFFEPPLSSFVPVSHDTIWVAHDLYFKTNFLLLLYIWEHLKVISSESQNKHPLGSTLSV